MSGGKSDAEPSGGPLNRDTGDALLWGTPYRTVARLRGAEASEIVTAEHLATGRRVQVKVLRLDEASETPSHRRARGDRVRLEGEALRQLRHPNVVELLDSGQTPDGRPYFVSAPLEHARAVSELLVARPGGLPVTEALSLAIDVLAALEAAHAIGVVHRDVKPMNVLVTQPPTPRRVLLDDFGIAKVVAAAPGGPAPLEQPTEAGARLGTPRYLSPELALGGGVGPASDVYQVGLLLFELLAGRGPFEDHQGVEALVLAHTGAPAPALSSVAEQPLPPALDALVARALAKRPEDRFPSAFAFAAALRAVAGDQLGQGERGLLRQLGPGGTDVLDRDAVVQQLHALGSDPTEELAVTPPPSPAEPGPRRARAAAVWRPGRGSEPPTRSPVKARGPEARKLLWPVLVALVFVLGFVVARCLP